MINLERIVVRLVGDASHFEKTMKKASSTVDSVARKIESTGKSLSLKVTTPLSIIGSASLAAFGSFDSAMTQSTAIMQVTEKQIERMKNQALDLGTEGAVGPTQLAESYYFLASAGLDAEQSMATLPTVAKFATAGMFDMSTATDLLTDAQSALGLEFDAQGKNITRLGNALVKANTMANASVQQFSEALTNDAATASLQFNMEMETTLALLATYADKGKKGAEAGSLLGRAVRLMAGAYSENAEVFEKYGIDVIDKATGEYRNFIDIVQDMEVAFKDLTGPQKAVALEQLGFAALAQKSILPLLGVSEKTREYERNLKNAGDVMEDVAGKQGKSFSAQMKNVWNNVKAAGIAIGEILAPAVSMIAGWIKSLTEWFRSLNPAIQKTIVYIGVAVAVIGPLLVAISMLLKFGGFLLATLGGAMAVFGKVALVTATVTAATLALKVAIVALVAWLGGKLIAATYEAIFGFKRMAEEAARMEKASIAMVKGRNKETLDRAKAMKDEEERLKYLSQQYERVSKDVVGYQHDVDKGTEGGDYETRLAEAKAFQAALQEEIKATEKILGITEKTTDAHIAQAEAKRKLITDSIDFAAKLEEETRYLGMTTDEATLAKMASEGLEQARIDEIQGLIDAKTAKEEYLRKLEEEKDAKAQLEQNSLDLVKQYAAEYAMMTMSNTDRAVAQAQLQGVSEEYLQQIRILSDLMEEQKKHDALMQKGEQLTKKYRSSQEIYNDTVAELDELLSGGHITDDTYVKAIEDARKELQKEIKIPVSLSGVDSLEVGSRQALLALQNAQVRALYEDTSVSPSVSSKGGSAKAEGREDKMTEYLRIISEALLGDDGELLIKLAKLEEV